MSRFSPKQRMEIKLMFVQQGKSALEISKHFGSKPSVQTIINWSKKKNSEGVSWEDEREQFEVEEYESLSPQSQAKKILRKINVVLSKSDRSFTTKDADALSKLQKSMEKLIDKKFQIPTMFKLLTHFLEFLSANYKNLVTAELINATRHFKNVLKEEME